jgi:hypothetical protein
MKRVGVHQVNKMWQTLENLQMAREKRSWSMNLKMLSEAYMQGM